MARATMTPLISRVRTLIGDPAGASQQFTDDDISNALDLYRAEVRYGALLPTPTFNPGGQIVYLDYYSTSQNWETDYTFQTLDYAAVTPTATEPLVGHFQFTTQPAGLSVRITGKTYDIFAAAADLLEQWAAVSAATFSFSSDDQRFDRGQVTTNRMALATAYRKRAQPRSVTITQSDEPDWAGGEPNSVVYPMVGGSGYA